jgi:hypothetical protein
MILENPRPLSSPRAGRQCLSLPSRICWLVEASDRARSRRAWKRGIVSGSSDAPPTIPPAVPRRRLLNAARHFGTHQEPAHPRSVRSQDPSPAEGRTNSSGRPPVPEVSRPTLRGGSGRRGGGGATSGHGPWPIAFTGLKRAAAECAEREMRLKPRGRNPRDGGTDPPAQVAEAVPGSTRAVSAGTVVDGGLNSGPAHRPGPTRGRSGGRPRPRFGLGFLPLSRSSVAKLRHQNQGEACRWSNRCRMRPTTRTKQSPEDLSPPKRNRAHRQNVSPEVRMVRRRVWLRGIQDFASDCFQRASGSPHRSKITMVSFNGSILPGSGGGG